MPQAAPAGSTDSIRFRASAPRSRRKRSGSTRPPSPWRTGATRRSRPASRSGEGFGMPSHHRRLELSPEGARRHHARSRTVSQRNDQGGGWRGANRDADHAVVDQGDVEGQPVGLLVLTCFLDANRYPLHSKTLWTHAVAGSSNPVSEARCDSSIQLPSGSRTIEILAVLPSVTGARASRPPWASTYACSRSTSNT